MAETVSPPRAPRIDVRKNPLTWLAREFNVHKKVGMLDSALFFDTSMSALAPDETAFLEFSRDSNKEIPYKRKYTVETQLPFGEEREDVQPEFGEKDSWPKLRWSNFEMLVYELPSEENKLEKHKLVRKITVEQSKSGDTRRILLQGRSTENGPWIAANIQFDLDSKDGYKSVAHLDEMTLAWTDEKKTEWGLSFKPRLAKEANASFSADDVHMYRHVQGTGEEFETIDVAPEKVPQIIATSVEENTAYVEVSITGQPVKLPIPLSLLTSAKLPTAT